MAEHEGCGLIQSWSEILYFHFKSITISTNTRVVMDEHIHSIDIKFSNRWT